MTSTSDSVLHILLQDRELKSYSIKSMPLWSMKLKEEQVKQVEEFANVITVEDHLIDGGFGSWLLEAVSVTPYLLSRIKIKALHSKVCEMVAKQSTLIEQGGLTQQLLCE